MAEELQEFTKTIARFARWAARTAEARRGREFASSYPIRCMPGNGREMLVIGREPKRSSTALPGVRRDGGYADDMISLFRRVACGKKATKGVELTSTAAPPRAGR